MNAVCCRNPRAQISYRARSKPYSDMSLMSFNSRIPVDSILEAVLTVSPKRQYLGMVKPTTPATQEPTQGHACLFKPTATYS